MYFSEDDYLYDEVNEKLKAQAIEEEDEFYDRPYVTARCALNEHDYCYDPECSCNCHKVIIYYAKKELSS